MSVTEAGTNQDADQLRQHLIALSTKQAELRRRLNEYLQSSGTAVGTVARLVNMKWGTLNKLSKGEVVVGSGRGLTALCHFLQCDDLGEEITALTRHISDRFIGFATCTPVVIETAFDIRRAFFERAETVSAVEFAGAFEEYSAIVQGAITGSKSALQALEDEDTRDYVNLMLIDGLDERLALSKVRHDQEKQAAADHFVELVKPLLDRFGGKSSLARVFEVHNSTVHAAMTGEASLETIQRLTVLAERHARNNGQAAKDPPTPQAQATGPPPPKVETPKAEARPAATVPEGPAFQGEQLIRALLDMSREELVAFVQTEANFQELERVQLLALRDALVVSGQVMTLLLNIGSQVGSKQAREMLQNDIGRVLQELEPAIKRFTFAYPNKLLELHDSQRQVMAQGKSKHPQNRKGSK